MAINVISNIEPYGGNTWYLVEDAFIKGGFRVVANKLERDEIDPVNLKAGMLVCTSDDHRVWQLSSDLTEWNQFKTDSTASFRLGMYAGESPVTGDIDYVFSDKVYFANDFAGCKASALDMPSHDVPVDIQKNRNEFVGQILFTPSSITFSGLPISFQDGDVLTLKFPEGTDVGKVSITLKGSFDPL